MGKVVNQRNMLIIDLREIFDSLNLISTNLTHTLKVAGWVVI